MQRINPTSPKAKSMRMRNFTFIKMGHPNITIGITLKIFQAVGRAIKSVEFYPRSTDLTALDFHLWECLNDAVDHTKPEKVNELREEIDCSSEVIQVHTLFDICQSSAKCRTA